VWARKGEPDAGRAARGGDCAPGAHGASLLIERFVTHQGLLSPKDVELAIKTMFEQMSQALSTGDRIEIRGFGSFRLHFRAPGW